MQILSAIKLSILRLCPIGLALTLVTSCSTPPVKIIKLSPQEQSLVDQELARTWPERIEGQIATVRDVDIEISVRKLAEGIIVRREALALSPIGVILYDRRDSILPDSFAIPGNRIYVSKQLLRSLEFENELVAALSLECANLLARTAVSHAALPPSSGSEVAQAGLDRRAFFGPGGIFTFTYQERVAAVREAVHLTYESGYDPRGLVSYLRKIQNTGGGDMDAATLAQLEEAARSELNRLPPLRNPVVRGETFRQIKKRIQKL